jgi:hypothetical protein
MVIGRSTIVPECSTSASIGGGHDKCERVTEEDGGGGGDGGGGDGGGGNGDRFDRGGEATAAVAATTIGINVGIGDIGGVGGGSEKEEDGGSEEEEDGGGGSEEEEEEEEKDSGEDEEEDGGDESDTRGAKSPRRHAASNPMDASHTMPVRVLSENLESIRSLRSNSGESTPVGLLRWPNPKPSSTAAWSCCANAGGNRLTAAAGDRSASELASDSTASRQSTHSHQNPCDAASCERLLS